MIVHQVPALTQGEMQVGTSAGTHSEPCHAETSHQQQQQQQGEYRPANPLWR